MKKNILKQESGYTLVELLIAMAIFSFMLVIIVVGYLQMVRLYRTQNVARAVQQNGRFAVEQMVREARIAYQADVSTPDQICLYTPDHNVKFWLSSNEAVPATVYQLHQTQYGGKPGDIACSAVTASTPGATDSTISSADTAAIRLTATYINVAEPALILNLDVASDYTLLNAARTACDSTKQGLEFCNFRTLSTTVTLRGGKVGP